MRPNTTPIYQMFGQGNEKQAIGSPSVPGNRLFGAADGSHAVGPFKSFLPLGQSGSSPKKASA